MAVVATLQLVKSMCGCPAVEDHCRCCDEWGDEVPREYADRTMPLSPEYFGKEVGSEITCEEAFYSQYQFASDDDTRCASARFGAWECGYNGGSATYLNADTKVKRLVHQGEEAGTCLNPSRDRYFVCSGECRNSVMSPTPHFLLLTWQ